MSLCFAAMSFISLILRHVAVAVAAFCASARLFSASGICFCAMLLVDAAMPLFFAALRAAQKHRPSISCVTDQTSHRAFMQNRAILRAAFVARRGVRLQQQARPCCCLAARQRAMLLSMTIQQYGARRRANRGRSVYATQRYAFILTYATPEMSPERIVRRRRQKSQRAEEMVAAAARWRCRPACRRE